jgi:metallo-beta-lactamase family protein
MKIEFQGAARVVTGSMHVLHANGYRILLDCGLFQGKRALANQINRNFPFDPKSVDALVLSHAHIDHCGNIPNLVKHGFAGPIFCTPATLDLCAIMLADSGHIQEKDAEFLNKQLARKHEPPIVPLYTAEDAVNAIKSFKTFGYEKEFEVLPGVRVTYYDAGHILGSASVKVTVTENGSKKILGFSGDVGRWNMPILKDPAAMGDVDALINESTYGGKLHDPPSDMEGELAADLKKTFDRGGKVIIPAFSVGRTQDIVYSMHKMWDRGELPPVPVYVDSPLAVNATDVFKKHPECFDAETWEHLNRHHDPFGFNRLTYVRTVDESKKLNDRKEPCVIISASGMCEAGRILHHLRNNITDPRNTVLIVGYQAEYTLGKRLVDGDPEVKIFGEVVKRNAEVIVHNSFSAHADGAELVKYIGMFGKTQLGKIFLVHGELDRSTALKSDLDSRGYKDVEIPSRGQTFDL